LLADEFVDYFILALELYLHELELGAETSVFVLQIVGRHPLLHHVFVQAFTFLVDDSWPELAHLEVDLARSDAFGMLRAEHQVG